MNTRLIPSIYNTCFQSEKCLTFIPLYCRILVWMIMNFDLIRQRKYNSILSQQITVMNSIKYWQIPNLETETYWFSSEIVDINTQIPKRTLRFRSTNKMNRIIRLTYNKRIFPIQNRGRSRQWKKISKGNTNKGFRAWASLRMRATLTHVEVTPRMHFPILTPSFNIFFEKFFFFKIYKNSKNTSN